MKKSSKKNKQNKGERTDTTVIGGCKVTDNRKVKSVEETKPDDEMADQRESSNRAAQLTRRQRKNRNKNSVSAKQGEYKEDSQTKQEEAAAIPEFLGENYHMDEYQSDTQDSKNCDKHKGKDSKGSSYGDSYSTMQQLEDASNEAIDNTREKFHGNRYSVNRNSNTHQSRRSQGYGRDNNYDKSMSKNSYSGGRGFRNNKNSHISYEGDMTQQLGETPDKTIDYSKKKSHQNEYSDLVPNSYNSSVMPQHDCGIGHSCNVDMSSSYNRKGMFNSRQSGHDDHVNVTRPMVFDGHVFGNPTQLLDGGEAPLKYLEDTTTDSAQKKPCKSDYFNQQSQGSQSRDTKRYNSKETRQRRDDHKRSNQIKYDKQWHSNTNIQNDDCGTNVLQKECWDSGEETNDDLSKVNNLKSVVVSGNNSTMAISTDIENESWNSSAELECSKDEAQITSWSMEYHNQCSTSSSNFWKSKNNSTDNKQRTSDGGDRNRSRNINWDDFKSEKIKDKEFEVYLQFLKSKFEYVKVKEIECDLFSMSEEYSLAHCVAEDMNMGSGIAVQFSQKFKKRPELYSQKQKQGGLAILEDEGRYIYYLVTKRESNNKPTLHTMFLSLKKLQKHISENDVKKLAIPRIGCGLDRLKWPDVKGMLEFVFQNTDVEITVCNFQQPDSDQLSPVRPSRFSRGCYVKQVLSTLVDIEEGTAIVYLGTTDNHVSEELEKLNTKFNIIGDYKSSVKHVGDVLVHYRHNGSYGLFGFIVNKTKDEPFDFISFNNCVVKFNKVNKQYYYLGFQAFKDANDDLLMSKIINIFKYGLRRVEVYICWGDKMVPPYMI